MSRPHQRFLLQPSRKFALMGMAERPVLGASREGGLLLPLHPIPKTNLLRNLSCYCPLMDMQ